jgi:histidinol-phosphatase (PHP family)
MSVCGRAVEAGLGGIAITDHVDMGSGADVCRRVIGNLKRDVAEARGAFGGRLEISAGMELGEAHHNLSLARELASDEGIDFIIGSLHHPRDSVDYYYVEYDSVDMDAMFRGYFDELEEMASAGCYDVLGHIGYQLRYMSAPARSRADMSAYHGRVRGILREVARAGKGIEINTSGLWKGLGFTLPSREIVRIFREEGGEIVTTGSDAHKLEQIGGAMDGAAECLKSAGFERFAFFGKREPRFHNV